MKQLHAASPTLRRGLDAVALWHSHESVSAAQEPELPDQEIVRWLVASRGTDMVVLMTTEILYFQADLKYTRVVWSQGSALIRRGIGELQRMLDAQMFLRIHRSTIVNIHHVRSVRRDELGRLGVTIKDHDDVLVVSKPFERFFRPF